MADCGLRTADVECRIAIVECCSPMLIAMAPFHFHAVRHEDARGLETH